MNYLREIKAFYDRQETNPLSSSAISLWHALMHIANKAGWPEEFAVAVSVLSLKSGLKERTLYHARNELKQKGYIRFRSRGGNQSAKYSLIPLSASLPAHGADSQADTAADTMAVAPADSSAPLIKQNGSKQSRDLKREQETNPHAFYEANGFGLLSPFIAEEISLWLDGGYFSEPEAVVIEAMKQALASNVRNWKYVDRILNDWDQQGLKGLADVKSHLAERRKKRASVTQLKPRGKGDGKDDHHWERIKADYAKYDFGF